MAEAITYTQFGGPEVLALVDIPTPTPAPGEIVVRVEAAGVNPIDGKVRSGQRASGPITEPRRVGGGRCRIVTAVGDEVDGFRIGEPSSCSARRARTRPRSSSRRERAASTAAGERRRGRGARHPGRHRLPVAALARRRPVDTLLVHAGSGAVGQAAIQFAVLWGAVVIATASERGSIAIRELGATPSHTARVWSIASEPLRRRASRSPSTPREPTRRSALARTRRRPRAHRHDRAGRDAASSASAPSRRRADAPERARPRMAPRSTPVTLALMAAGGSRWSSAVVPAVRRRRCAPRGGVRHGRQDHPGP
jgi:hypothetical protein